MRLTHRSLLIYGTKDEMAITGKPSPQNKQLKRPIARIAKSRRSRKAIYCTCSGWFEPLDHQRLSSIETRIQHGPGTFAGTSTVPSAEIVSPIAPRDDTW
jgi:hypothetical protein